MNHPSTLLDSLDLKCKICFKNAHGTHFGVQACRACAAFFRRTTVLNRKYRCKMRKGDCEMGADEKLNCRYCRLKKCIELGMTTENVRLEEAPTGPLTKLTVTRMDTREPAQLIDVAAIIKASRNYLEMHYLPDDDAHRRAGLNQLQKLADVLRKFRAPQKSEVTFFKEIKFYEIFKNWLVYMEQTAQFLMYCTEFRGLPVHERIAFFKIVWAVWRRFERYSMSAEVFGQKCYDEKILLQSIDTAGRINEYYVDYSTFTDFDYDRVKCLFGGKLVEYFDVIVKPYIEMRFDATETAYILSQICWSYAARRLQGQTLTASEKFLAEIGDNLHEYYKTEKVLNYAPRIMKMMQIVNSMLAIQLKCENAMDLAMLFNFYNVILTEPEFFRV